MPVLPSPEVVSMGNMLVEVMRTQRDVPLSRPGEFAGPYPSGDTCIYIDAVARFANAAGALAVTRLGPMEGAPTRAQVLDLLQNTSTGRV